MPRALIRFVAGKLGLFRPVLELSALMERESTLALIGGKSVFFISSWSYILLE